MARDLPYSLCTELLRAAASAPGLQLQSVFPLGNAHIPKASLTPTYHWQWSLHRNQQVGPVKVTSHSGSSIDLAFKM